MRPTGAPAGKGSRCRGMSYSVRGDSIVAEKRMQWSCKYLVKLESISSRENLVCAEPSYVNNNRLFEHNTALLYGNIKNMVSDVFYACILSMRPGI